MHFTLDQITLLIIQYKYLILFPFLVIEGPVVTIIAAFLASPAHKILNLPILFIEVVVADLTGDIFYYCVGRFGGLKVVSRWGSKFGLTKERFVKIEDHFKDHGGKTVAAGKIGHGFGWPTMIVAGATCMNFFKFLMVCLGVSIVKSVFLMFLGYYYGKSYNELSNNVHNGGLLLSAVLLAVIIIYFVIRRPKNKAI